MEIRPKIATLGHVQSEHTETQHGDKQGKVEQIQEKKRRNEKI